MGGKLSVVVGGLLNLRCDFNFLSLFVSSKKSGLMKCNKAGGVIVRGEQC